MPDIRPFRALRYAPTHRQKIDQLVCPPYDVISPETREALVQKNPLNFVRVELPEGDPRTRYDTAAALWKRWQTAGVLRRDRGPAFYIYEVHFRSQIDGRPLVRQGFFAALKVVPWGEGIFPHEKTLPTPKADRFQLFKALKAQTSPIQLLADDSAGKIAELVAANQKGKPDMEFIDENRVIHKLWLWHPNGDARSLMELFVGGSSAIADGHHRYETALAYSQWARRRWKNNSPASHYVMAYFSSADDKGMEILPTHRAVAWEKRNYVRLPKWGKLSKVSGLGALKSLMDGKKKAKELGTGVFHDGKYYLYRFTQVPRPLRNTVQQTFPVACLHAGPLDGLGKEDFFFTRRPEEAVARAKATKGWAFLLAPNTVREVLDTARAGLVMPPKSTYFYPKIPSGMVSHSLQGGL